MTAMTLSDPLSVGGAAVVVTLLVQLLKPWVPEKLVPHTTALIGIVVVVAAAVVLGQTSAEQLGNAVLTGFLAGTAAVGLYELQGGTVRAPKAGGRAAIEAGRRGDSRLGARSEKDSAAAVKNLRPAEIAGRPPRCGVPAS